MLQQMLVEIRQQELRAEADRERLARLARPARADRRRTLRGRPSLTDRLRRIGVQLRRDNPVRDRHSTI